MKTFIDSPTDGIVHQLEKILDRTATILFLSPTAMQLLAEFAGDDNPHMVIFTDEVDALTKYVGIDLRHKVVDLDERTCHFEEFESFNVENKVLPDIAIEQSLFWQQMNVHPRRPGPNQRTGGKRVRLPKCL